jgi:SAM-dependent methyltransferase
MKKILELGCGNSKHKFVNAEVIGLDFYDVREADIKWDLESGKLPFKDNEFDGIIAEHTLEHIKNLLPLINEMWRVVKPNGIIKIECPYFASSLAHSSMDHVRFFSYTSFFPYRKEDPYHYFWKPITFEVKARYDFSQRYGLKTIGKIIDFFTNMFPRVYQRLWCFILPTEVIKYELKVIKTL